MEFHPEHLQYLGANPDSNGIVSREVYLNAMRAKIGEATGKQIPPILFRDFESLTLSLSQKEADYLFSELSELGYKKKKEGKAIVFNGPQITIRILVNPNPKYRIAAFRLKFSGLTGEEREIQLSDELKIYVNKDSTTDWIFGNQL